MSERDFTAEFDELGPAVVSEYPSIPCPDCTKPLHDMRDGTFFCHSCQSEFTRPWGLTPWQLTVLWREWTRGMAVIKLPTPESIASNADESRAICGGVSEGSPFVRCFGEDWTPVKAEQVAVRLLAAVRECDGLMGKMRS